MSKEILFNTLSFLRKIYLPLAILFITYIAIIHLPDLTAITHYSNIIDILTYIYAILLAFISYLFRTIRWLFYIRKIEKKASNLHHSIIYLSGFAFTASPGKSGELMRATHLNQLHVPFTYTLVSFLSERLLDVLIVLFFGIYIIVFITKNSLFFLFIPILLILPFLLNPILAIKQLSKYTQKFALIRYGLVLWQVKMVLMTMILTAIAWSAQGIILYLFLITLGAEITWISAISIYCLSLLIGAVSLIPGGFGATELGMSWLLIQIGIPTDLAFTAALFTRVFTLWPAMFTGMICSGLLSSAKFVITFLPTKNSNL